MRELGELDRKILIVLQKEGRISNVDLAKQINLSPTPCLERVKRLERDGFIRGYSARLDPKLLKVSFLTFIAVNLERTSEDVFGRFAKEVRRMPEIVECHMIGGGYDYLLKIRTENMAAFRKFLGEKLSTLPEVSQTHSYFVMEEVMSATNIPVRQVV